MFGLDHVLSGADHVFSSLDHIFCGPDHVFCRTDHVLSGADHVLSAPDHTSSGPENAFSARKEPLPDPAKPRHAASAMSCPPRVAIPLVAEGADWLVVGKPAGLLVHPTRPDGTFTLLEALRGLLAFEIGQRRAGFPRSPVGPRNQRRRMLVAKTAAAARRFSMDLMRGLHPKKNISRWCGVGRSGTRGRWTHRCLRQGEKRAVAHLAQAHDPPGRRGGANAAGGGAAVRAAGEWRRAVSRWCGRGRKRGASTRSRVHLAHTGHPVVGDKIYGPDEGCYLEFIETGWTPVAGGVGC